MQEIAYSISISVNLRPQSHKVVVVVAVLVNLRLLAKLRHIESKASEQQHSHTWKNKPDIQNRLFPPYKYRFFPRMTAD